MINLCEFLMKLQDYSTLRVLIMAKKQKIGRNLNLKIKGEKIAGWKRQTFPSNEKKLHKCLEQIRIKFLCK